jgi:hypothetical protein
MRALSGASIPFAALWLAAGCNALFGVEDPVRVEDVAEGGTGGEPPLPPYGGNGGFSEGHEGGSGGVSGVPKPDAGDAGVAGMTADAGRDGGSGGAVGGQPATGGRPTAGSGGNQTTAGTLGVAGEPSTTGGAAGADGAAGAAGGPECASGSARCVNENWLEICDRGALVLEECIIACIDDDCADCEPGTAQCLEGDTKAKLCQTDGQLGPELTCTNKTCNPNKGCDGECAPGQVRCHPEDGDAEHCSAGTWLQVDDCEAVTERCVVEGSKSECIDNDPIPLGPEQPLSGGSLRDRTSNVLYTFKLPRSSEDAIALQAGLIGDGQPAVARLALYEDTGTGYPGTLVSYTNRVDVQAPAPDEGLLTPSGALISRDKDYWLGVVFGTAGSPQLFCRDNQGAPTHYLVSQMYGSELPTIFPGDALDAFDLECNLFLRIRAKTP